MTTIHESGKAVFARQWLIFGVVGVIWLAGVNGAFAQSVSSGTIEGTVKDESNAVLPGVTVTVTSPQLQVGQLVQVSDAAGAYKFVDLPAGTYRLKAELTGFSSSIREDLRLTVGFNARVDFTLKLGAMEESVTVSGQSPVVDITSTTAQRRVHQGSARFDSARPRPAERVCDGAGVTQAVADVGGSTMAQRQNLSSYGVLSQPKLQVEGMNITMGADQNTAIYFNDSTLEEMQIRTSGNDAEVSVPGISMVAIMKSGGNDFHGTYQVSAQSRDPGRQPERRLARAGAHRHVAAEELLRPVCGSRRPDRPRQAVVLRRVRAAGQEGGPARVRVGPGPDGKYLTADDPLANFESRSTQISAKLSYQLTKNNRLVYAWQRGTKAQPQNNADRFTPLESTRDYKNPTAIQKIELQSMINPRVLRERRGRLQRLRHRLRCGPLVPRADAPPRQDLATT